MIQAIKHKPETGIKRHGRWARAIGPLVFLVFAFNLTASGFCHAAWHGLDPLSGNRACHTHGHRNPEHHDARGMSLGTHQLSPLPEPDSGFVNHCCLMCAQEGAPGRHSLESKILTPSFAVSHQSPSLPYSAKGVPIPFHRGPPCPG